MLTRANAIRTFLLLLCFGVSAGRGFAQNSAEESKLIAFENAWNQAQIQHDSEALNNLVGDHFVYTDTDGTVMNKAQFLADIQDPDYRATLVANDGVKVHIYQTSAVVIGTYHTKGTYKGKAFDHYGRFTDTWIYQSKGWQCVASHTTQLSKK
jgi:hypothetical protein